MLGGMHSDSQGYCSMADDDSIAGLAYRCGVNRDVGSGCGRAELKRFQIMCSLEATIGFASVCRDVFEWLE